VALGKRARGARREKDLHKAKIFQASAEVLLHVYKGEKTLKFVERNIVAGKTKILSPSDAINLIRSGDRILFSCHCGEPLTLLDALVKQEESLENVQLISGLLFGSFPFLNKASFHFITWHSLPHLGKLIAEGKVGYLPIRYSQTVSTFLPEGALPIDVIIIRVSPPDNRGYCSIGISPSYSLPVSLSAKKVIAEISEEIPRSPGNSFIHESGITCFVESAFSPTEYQTGDISQEEQKVVDYVTELIEDGSTIEIGIGSIPSAVIKNLIFKKDIRIHSGMVSDDVIDLVEAGAVSISRSNNKNRIFVGELIGTKKLFSFAHENPIFEMATVDYTHNPVVMSSIPKFVAINSALEIDLSGQVNSETADGLQIGGVGGILDFCIGVSLSPGGKVVIAMTSTAKKGKVSKIVLHLSSGSTVTVPRHYIDYVVTEYGVAHLSGKDLIERAEALIGIAHPSVRDELSNQFVKNLKNR
jgi:4-hydroxybutyrate CoA-transferase